jgi:hypothetical protein
MLKLTVHDVENDRNDYRYGSDGDLLKYLKMRYPQLRDIYSLAEAIRAMNDSDIFVVSAEQYEPGVEANLLRPDYVTHSQADEDDPWVRRGDQS